MDYDIAIIGGGPAGLTLARLLSAQFRIVLLDKKDYSGKPGFEKCCGGLLNPDAQQVFAKFALGFPLEIMSDPQIFSVRAIDIACGQEQYYKRAYTNFNRHKFDLWLARLVPDTVTVLDSTRCSALERLSSGFRLTYQSHREKQTLTATYVVGAEGARSLVRDTLFPTPIRQYLAIQHSFPIQKEDMIPPHYTSFFHQDITDSYGWIGIKDGQAQLGAALYPKTATLDFLRIKEYFQKEGYPFDTPSKVKACLINRPASIREIETGKDNAFLIGEAAGFVSTSSLEGISYAMESAMMLAEALNKSNHPNRSYNRKTKKLTVQIFTKILKSIVIYTPFLRRLAMKSGLTAISMHTQAHTQEK